MKHFKNIISFMISLVLMFTLLLTIFMVFFKSTLINENYYSKIIQGNKTSEKVYNGIYKDINYILLANNVSQDVAKDIITQKEIYDYENLATGDVIKFFLGKTEEISAVNVDIYMERLNTGIDTYIQNNNVRLTQQTTNVFNEIRESTKEILSSELEPINYNELSKSETAKNIQKISVLICDSKIFIATIVVDVILCLLLIFIWYRSRYKGYAWMGYSFASSGALVSILFISGIISKFYENALINSVSLKANVASIIEGYLTRLSIIGVIFILIGLIFTSIYWRYLYKEYKEVQNGKLEK